MKKILFYAMTGEKMCFQHVLLNALQLADAGWQVKIIFEGSSVKLPLVLTSESNKLYQKAIGADLIAGICLACSRALGVYEANAALGLPMLDDMNGHAGMRSYVTDGWQVVSM
ncbi:MAG: hypothetical protein GX797_00590 [Chloroflexi bacterium]|jgi:hypothetical protein|nr:hypothetical protein [Chloroflexota bacterium]